MAMQKCESCEYPKVGIHICVQAKAYDMHRLINWNNADVRKYNRLRNDLEAKINRTQLQNIDLQQELNELELRKIKLLHKQRMIRQALNEHME
jgi:hypothetical protein